MARAYISEYTNLVVDESGRIVPVAQEPAVTQVVVYAASVQSAAFAEATRYVRIISEAKAHFLFGTNPTADGDDPYYPADVAEYFGVPKGASYKICFYDGST